jgi:hypothetical protein
MTVIEQAKTIRSAMDAAGAVLTDAEALGCKAIYKQWETLVEAAAVVEKGYRFLHGDDLYRVEQPSYTFIALYVPGTAGTESLFSRIDETHAGTVEDPIPYDGNMALEEGKFYSQDGVVYKCIWSTGNPVYHPLSQLVGLYVEVAA